MSSCKGKIIIFIAHNPARHIEGDWCRHMCYHESPISQKSFLMAAVPYKHKTPSLLSHFCSPLVIQPGQTKWLSIASVWAKHNKLLLLNQFCNNIGNCCMFRCVSMPLATYSNLALWVQPLPAQMLISGNSTFIPHPASTYTCHQCLTKVHWSLLEHAVLKGLNNWKCFASWGKYRMELLSMSLH